jgi:hypothetical protein
MRFCVSLLSLMLFLLAGCGRGDAVDYGFAIKNVSVNRSFQSLNIHLQQELELSQQAREALEHGVTLTINLEMELRNDDNLIVAQRDARHFKLRYLPLSERYQVSEEKTGELQAFSRLRHLLAALDDLDVQLSTGPLPTGNYELRTRILLDERRLPAPMQLPAWLSSQWQHDSEWSVWPFTVNV